MAEGAGFEPARGISPPKRLAGARTRPLCDPSNITKYSRANMSSQGKHCEFQYYYDIVSRNQSSSDSVDVVSSANSRRMTIPETWQAMLERIFVAINSPMKRTYTQPIMGGQKHSQVCYIPTDIRKQYPSTTS